MSALCQMAEWMPKRGIQFAALNVRFDSCRTDVEFFAGFSLAYSMLCGCVTLTFNTRLPVNVCSTLLLSYNNFDASFIFFSAQLIECISVWFNHSVFYLTLFSLRHFSSRLQMMAKVSDFFFVDYLILFAQFQFGTG